MLHPGDPFFVRHVNYDIRDSAIQCILESNGVGKRLLTDGMRFDVNKMNDERKRITEVLTDSGYYRFHKDYITYQADTVAGRRDIDLTLVLHKFVVGKDSVIAHPRYNIGSVTYSSGNPEDSVIHLRQGVLRSSTFIEEGQPYSSSALRRTYNQFGRLQAVKYTNIGFAENEEERIL